MARRAAARRTKTFHIKAREICARADILVDAKFEQVVMISANAKGRRVVADLWPDVEWARDQIFASSNPPDWQFTHVRVTKLPLHLEEMGIPLRDCAPDALGMAVAMALQRIMAEQERVAHFVGHGAEMQLHFYHVHKDDRDQDAARSLFVEYVPPTATVAGTA